MESINPNKIAGVYSNREIVAAIEQQEIICHPYNPENVQGSSIDVTLGKHYYRTEADSFKTFYNPYSQEDVDRYFKGPFQAVLHADWAETNQQPLFEGIEPDSQIIVLRPLERILGHTQEFIGIKSTAGTSTMQARSTWGRNGLAVCLDAGWGDPGFINRWTMEIYNMNRRHSLPLVVGSRVAQIIFHHTGPVDKEYASLSGKYQAVGENVSMEELRDAWTPGMMLPKAFKDRDRSQPSGIETI